MRHFLKSMYEPRYLDLLFGVLAALSITLIAISAGGGAPAIQALESGWVKALALLGSAIAVTVISTKTTDLDQKLADDFIFMTLTKSALITVMALLIWLVLWEVLFASSLGSIPGYGVLTILLAIWSTAYFLTRWKGTRA
tara:strand:+ start:4229 stop:4648 length:420 start_codon:yes stop_codon:yes gene_type:complete